MLKVDVSFVNIGIHMLSAIIPELHKKQQHVINRMKLEEQQPRSRLGKRASQMHVNFVRKQKICLSKKAQVFWLHKILLKKHASMVTSQRVGVQL